MKKNKFNIGDGIRPIKNECKDTGYKDQVYKVVRVYLHGSNETLDLDKELVDGLGAKGWYARRFEIDKQSVIHNILKEL